MGKRMEEGKKAVVVLIEVIPRNVAVLEMVCLVGAMNERCPEWCHV